MSAGLFWSNVRRSLLVAGLAPGQGDVGDASFSLNQTLEPKPGEGDIGDGRHQALLVREVRVVGHVP